MNSEKKAVQLDLFRVCEWVVSTGALKFEPAIEREVWSPGQ